MRVLVAEDKPRMARFLQRALQSEGYAVELAFDGEQALCMGLSGGMDLMVLDVMLPGRDGYDVIRNLRAAKQMLPTIMVSARDAMSDIVRGLDLGADDYLTKPFAWTCCWQGPPLTRGRRLSVDLQFAICRSTAARTSCGVRPFGASHAPVPRCRDLDAAPVHRPPDALVEAGWGGGEVVEGRLDVVIRGLRANVACVGESHLLYTARGVGYTLRADVP
jgi:DNA-binding response OmpR family regulator